MQGLKIKPNEIKTITCLEKGNFSHFASFWFWENYGIRV